MIRVAVVAAVPALRAGLRAMLEADREIQVVAEAASPTDLEPPAEIEVIVAVFEPGISGSMGRAWRWLGEAHALLFLIEAPEFVERVRALSLPVYGVLPLHASEEALRAAVRALREGLLVWAPELHPPAVQPALPAFEEDQAESLTPREIEVLRLLAEGLANKEIAARLGISEHTVKFHISSIYGKLGVVNRAEAVRVGLRRGLIPL
ncbi:LuxR C-terminal-related transcriptional regulator [Thermoflexus sp.]|uniref:helix-turn-helix transcriptional regulator n=1 Tax=Thermoflexus sp. TaxID=1969742 RepID=UPI0035E41740